MNFARYIAGVSYDVTLNDTYVQNAQDATLALAALGDGPEHYISQPSGMSDEMYASAYLGTSKGNLGAGHSDLPTDIIHGWLADESTSNFYTMGHRRYALSPTLTETGFGITYADSSAKYSSYTAMSVQGVSSNTDVTGVIWPAQNMPVEYFDSDYPWTITTGTVLAGETYVTITRERDGATWTIEDDFIEGAIGDGYIAVNNEYKGQIGCISFIPDNITYSAGDVYHVEISGSVTASYSVSFFSLSDSYTVQSSVSYGGGTVTETTPEVTEPEVEVEEAVADLSGASTWAQAELQEALDAGYPVAVYSDKFTESMTRGEFAHMLGLFLDVRWSFADSYNTVFTDLGDDTEQNYYINALYSWGVINGMTDTTFQPDALLTREQAAKLLKAAIDLRLVTTVTQDISGYADADLVDSWALDGVRYLNQVGVMNGTDDNCLNPDGNLTVQEAALMCYRLKP